MFDPARTAWLAWDGNPASLLARKATMMTILTGTRTTWFNARGPGATPTERYGWRDPKGVEWFDQTAARGEGAFASGLPYNTPGVALWTHATLKGYFLLTMPDHNLVARVRHLDISPVGDIDFDSRLAFLMFGSQDGVPDQSAWRAEYIGQALPAGTLPTIVNTRTGQVTLIPETM